MSDAYDRGRDTEREVAALLRKKLKVHVQRDKRSGAGINKADIQDYHQELPIFIECKDQETLKVKEWMRQTIQGASFNQIPTLVFRMDTELMAMLPFSSLVDLLLEVKELREEVTDLRAPVTNSTPLIVSQRQTNAVDVAKAVEKKRGKGAVTCRNGHIADVYGYCMQLGCKFSRGYRPPKKSKAA